MSAANALINQRYDSQRAATLQKMIDEAQKTLRDAGISGLTGVANIDAEHTAHNADIDATTAPAQVKAIQQKAVDLTYN